MYLHAIENQTDNITIDLLTKGMSPAGAIFETYVNSWSEAVKYKFKEPRFSKGWLVCAMISIEFEKHPSDKKLKYRIGKGMQPTICHLNIKDKLGNSYKASRTFACRPHNPLFEKQSSRMHSDSFLNHLVAVTQNE